jgi:hypothetical protein
MLICPFLVHKFILSTVHFIMVWYVLSCCVRGFLVHTVGPFPHIAICNICLYVLPPSALAAFTQSRSPIPVCPPPRATKFTHVADTAAACIWT